MSEAVPVDESTIGETPLVKLPLDAPPTVYAKVEWFNLYEQPYGGGSVKTRIGKSMLDAAADAGHLDDVPTIIEPSSGNTGTAIARLGGHRGYDVEIYLPPRPSEAKVLAIEDAGGEVTRSRTYERMIEDCAERVAEATDDACYNPNQYENPANPAVHERETGREIWEQTDGEVTHFVGGVGTGGTVTGVGRALHDRGDVSVIGYEPARPSHTISGLRYARGPAFDYPGTFDPSVVDRRRVVTSSAARRWARRLRQRVADVSLDIRDPGQHDAATVRNHLRVDDQFLVGPSTGGVLAAFYEHAMDGGFADDDVVVLMAADRGDRYTSFPDWADHSGSTA
ncbi:PLP-dependent cysteine synthase family protein [Haloplanus halobius]|uniref:PLP-dependent cysteine synthase family protein n=1 Tax=Haloplanus halobius TaxID=2934938 RepID=UPI00200D1D67|nr:pyridoxal-phosphate dependent enzyme [Haloplanus sp. XH21]